MDFRALLKNKDEEKKKKNADEREKGDLKHGIHFKINKLLYTFGLKEVKSCLI